MRSLLLTTAALAALSTPALAATAVDEVIVTAARLPSSPDVITGAHVIDRAEIEARGVGFAADLLSTVPGVSLARTGAFGGTAAIRIRGASPDKTLVLIDGVPVNDPSDPNGPFDAGALQAADLERVEILSGPQGSLWGSEAIGGVVAFTTRELDRRPGQPGSRIVLHRPRLRRRRDRHRRLRPVRQHRRRPHRRDLQGRHRDREGRLQVAHRQPRRPDHPVARRPPRRPPALHREQRRDRRVRPAELPSGRHAQPRQEPDLAGLGPGHRRRAGPHAPDQPQRLRSAAQEHRLVARQLRRRPPGAALDRGQGRNLRRRRGAPGQFGPPVVRQEPRPVEHRRLRRRPP